MRPIIDMKAIIYSSTESPREITQTLKRLSIVAESLLGTITGYFFSWPVDPRDYLSPEWIAPLELIEVQDNNKIVLCKVLDLDFFVNLYFMRWKETTFAKKNGALTFLLVNNKSGDKIRISLINVINKTIDGKAKKQQSLENLHQTLFQECRDSSLCLYSIRKEDLLEESIQPVEVMVSYGEQTPEALVRAFQG